MIVILLRGKEIMDNVAGVLPEDPLEAEKVLIRVVTDAYRKTAAWQNDQNESDSIEIDIQNVSAPAALGLSPEFDKWDRVATAAGVIWEVDDEGVVRVQY